MASFPRYKLLILILLVPLSSSSANDYPLDVNFYDESCPDLLEIVGEGVANAIKNETRMGASLLRLHFHDCFVNGCDGSILLDDTPTLKGEKRAGANINSVRGFDVIDAIKTSLESRCPNTVSCADILAMAAMHSVYQLGGFAWKVQVGRRDSLTASQAQANKSLPSPKSDLKVLISKFSDVGLNKRDLVVLSGAHTIGQAQCKNFRDRLYSERNIDSELARDLKRRCPKTAGKSDDNLEPLDKYSPMLFDNAYFGGLSNEEGLLHSDQQLFRNEGDVSIRNMVMKYTEQGYSFLSDFVDAMIKMGGIKPLTGSNGQIRTNCRVPNSS